MTDLGENRLRENIAKIRETIAESAVRAGRRPEEIILCAASKTQSIQTVKIASNLNIDIFGENRVQELTEKYDAGAYGEKKVHMIGHLQTNKVRQTVGRADIIESVDSKHLLDAICAEAAKHEICQKIMIEINIGGELSKSGIAAEELWDMLEYAEGLDAVEVCGLMSIPPRYETDDDSRRCFAELKSMFDRAVDSGYGLKYLSMGMSADYVNAILEGANIVRIGTAIFGQREYK